MKYNLMLLPCCEMIARCVYVNGEALISRQRHRSKKNMEPIKTDNRTKAYGFALFEKIPKLSSIFITFYDPSLIRLEFLPESRLPVYIVTVFTFDNLLFLLYSSRFSCQLNRITQISCLRCYSFTSMQFISSMFN